jgi:hypothetical protein
MIINSENVGDWGNAAFFGGDDERDGWVGRGRKITE